MKICFVEESLSSNDLDEVRNIMISVGGLRSLVRIALGILYQLHFGKEANVLSVRLCNVIRVRRVAFKLGRLLWHVGTHFVDFDWAGCTIGEARYPIDH